jgi:hypothetical protein
VYEEVTGQPFPRTGDEGNALRADDWDVLREVCGDDPVFFDLQVALLGVERQYRGMSRRSGIYEVLEDRLRVGLYGSEEEALRVLGPREAIKERLRQPGLFTRELPVVELPKGPPDAEAEE